MRLQAAIEAQQERFSRFHLCHTESVYDIFVGYSWYVAIDIARPTAFTARAWSACRPEPPIDSSCTTNLSSNSI